MNIYGKEIALDNTAMHVAPGGSIACTIVGERSSVAEFLMAVREEIAFGMHVVEIVDEKIVKVDVHYGAADDDCFKEMLLKGDGTCAWEISYEAVAEGESRQAYSMSVRNKVIQALV